MNPNSGQAVCTGFHWQNGRSLYATASPILGAESGSRADANRVEEVIKDVLGQATGGLALYRDADIYTFLNLPTGQTWGPTGSYMKNHVRYQMDCADFLAEIKETALPANSYITGERDGKISIRPYFQAATTDQRLYGVADIQQDEAEEPNTAIVVICEDEKSVNMAATWFSDTYDPAGTGVAGSTTVSTMEAGNLIYRAVDGNTSAELSVKQADANYRGLINFTVPAASPMEMFPAITEVKIHGVIGYATVFVSQNGADYFVPGAKMLDINAATGAVKEVTVSGDAIAQTASVLDPTADWTLSVQIEADTSAFNIIVPASAGTQAQIAEIQIYSRKVNIHRAELCSDVAKVPAAYHPTDPLTQFGSIFVQADPGSSVGAGTAAEKVSYLWAPPTYLQKACPDYGATAGATKHRIKIVRLTGVSQFDARQLAETYLLEETYRSTPYRITAPLDDRHEIGDTIIVPFPDGTVKNLLLEGYSDGGDQTSELATYICTDRSATNREMEGEAVLRVAYADSAIVGLAVAG